MAVVNGCPTQNPAAKCAYCGEPSSGRRITSTRGDRVRASSSRTLKIDATPTKAALTRCG